MKTLRLALFAVAALLFSTAHAQDDDDNLIVNGSFEDTNGKIKKLGQLTAATGWTTANEEKADLFSKNSETQLNGVPKSEMGKANPKDGDNYAGILTHNVVSKDGREYITSKLKSKLKKDQLYCLSYSISLADVAKYATNNLGFHFSKKAVFEEKDIIIKDNAVVPRLNKAQTNMSNWEDLCMTFRGKGDETYVTIGNFSSARETVAEKVRKPSDISQEQMSIGYYFIDQIRLVPVDRESDCTCEEEKTDEGPRIIYSSTSALNDNATTAEKLTQSTVYFYENEVNLAGASKRTLDALIAILKADSKANVTIKGHMDVNEVEKGKEYDKFKDLSKTRAEEVKQYLTDNGVDSSRLETTSVKASEPATKMKTPLSLAKNRRVEFQIN